MKKRKVNLLSVILFSLILVTVGLIFTQSLLSPVASDHESNLVHHFLAEYISGFATGRFVLANLRKCAHFVEYAVLGFEVFAFLWSTSGNPTELLSLRMRRRALHRSGALGVFLALVDETLQIFSGRGPMIADVWLDYAGYLFGGIFLLLLAWLAKTSNRKKKAKNCK